MKSKTDKEILARLIDDTNMDIIEWKVENKDYAFKYSTNIKVDNKYNMPLSLLVVFYFYKEVSMHSVNFYLKKRKSTEFIRAIKFSDNIIPETEFHKLKGLIDFKKRK